MGKRVLQWHKSCLYNMQESLKRLEIGLEDIRERIFRLSNECKIYDKQIKRAEKEGKDSFDKDKFNVKR